MNESFGPRISEAIRFELDALQADQVRFLSEIVKMPSDNPPGDCTAHAMRTAELLELMGFTVERHQVPEAVVRANGMVSATNLIVRRRFGDGPIVALNAHGDVVPPGEGWARPPYGAEVADGWMYGRGVAVSKSDFATYAFALLALEPIKSFLKGTVELHFTYDEETGGEIGPAYILQEGLSKPDLVIAAGFSYAVVNGHNGCLHLEVQVDGRSAHAAKPLTGVDALQATTAILTRLYEWRGSLAGRVSAVAGIGSPQLTVGLITGGVNTNVVPDKVVFRLDRRFIPEENGSEVEAELNTIIQAAAGEHPQVQVTVRRILLAEPLLPLPGGEALSRTLCRHATQIMGEPVTTQGVPLYTDARHYSSRGIPAILYGAGPHTIEEANAHRADERLSLADLTKATRVIAMTLADLLTTSQSA